MNHQIQTLKDLSIPMPITQEAQGIAQEFANQQPTPEKAQQVYLNTLAIYLVHNYLKMMGIPTNLKARDSWNPVLRLAIDVADLEVMNLGRLECRPWKAVDNSSQENPDTFPSNAICHVPSEVQEDRIGYIVVQIDEEKQEGILLGFAKRITESKLFLKDLQSIDDLLDYLAELQDLQKVKPAVVVLSQWLEGMFEAGWQMVAEELFSPQSPQLAFRLRSESVKRYKLLTLEEGQSVELVIELMPADASKIDILVEVHPLNGQTYLPAHLGLILFNEEGEKVMEAQGKNENKNIQFDFSGEVGDRFSIQLVLGDVRVTENFVI